MRQVYNCQKEEKYRQLFRRTNQETMLSEIALRKSYTLLRASFLFLLLDALQKLLRAGLLQPRNLLGVLVEIGIPLQLLEGLFEPRPARHDAPLAAHGYPATLQMPGQSYARRVSQQNACHEYPEVRV